MNGGLVAYLVIPAFIVSLALLIFVILKSNLDWISKVLRNVLVENPGTASGDSYIVKHVPEPPGLFYGLSRPIAGLLTLKPDEILFVGYDPREMPVRLSLKLDTLKDVAWIGRFGTIGSEYWFVLNNGEKSYYFTAVTGRIVGDSKTESQKLFERITARYARDNEEKEVCTAN